MDAYDRCTNFGKKILPIVLPSVVQDENFSEHPRINRTCLSYFDNFSRPETEDRLLFMSLEPALKTRTSENFLKHSERYMSWHSSPFRDSHVFFKSLSMKSFEYTTLYLPYWKCFSFNFDSHSLIHLSQFGKR
jgi:hypothetical protein